MQPNPKRATSNRLGANRFEAFEVALALARALRGPLKRIKTHDSAMETQIRKAGSSVAQNLAEGRRRAGKDRLHHYRIAAGSADEIAAALQVAEAWGYLEPALIREPLELIDRVLAMTWRLTH